MGKALQVVLAEYTVKDAASASLTNIYRKNEQVNKSLRQGEQQAKKTQKSLEAMSKGIKGIGDNVKRMGGGTMNGMGTAMNSGGSGLVAKIPGIGGLFSAASSAVESAAQEFVAGISAGKNIKLLSNNFASAMGIGLDKSIYRARDRMAAYTKLGDIGVDKSLVGKNQAALEQFAKSQGHGSMDEAIQALASGNIKQGRGLDKSQIDLINAYKDLLGNAHTASTGFELIAGVLKEAEKGTKKYADAMDRSGTSAMVRTEGNIQTGEENYTADGAALFSGRNYAAMMRSRNMDRQTRARTQRAARGINNAQNRVVGNITNLYDNISQHGLVEGYRRANQQAAQETQETGGVGNYIFGNEDEAPTPRRAEGGPVAAGQMYTVGEHGRETFIPNSSGRIASAQSTKNMGGAKVTIHNHITVPMQGFADMLERETMKAMNKVGRSILPLHLGVQPRV